jgi:hypothetical protein
MAFAVSAPALELSRRRWMLALIVCIATLLTQRPLQRMNTATYFRDWFPYYIVRGDVPPEPTTSLYDVWRWRLLGTAALGVTIAAWRPPARLLPAVDREG